MRIGRLNAPWMGSPNHVAARASSASVGSMCNARPAWERDSLDVAGINLSKAPSCDVRDTVVVAGSMPARTQARSNARRQPPM